MPRVMLQDAWGMCYRIDTRDEAQLSSWFDEWLPRVWPAGSPDSQAPFIQVSALWIEGDPGASMPDWLTDASVTGRVYPLLTHTGPRAIELLNELHVQLAREVVTR